MIARNLLLFVLLIVLADAYIDWRYLRKDRLWRRLLWWMPAAAMLAYTAVLASERDFVPTDPALLNVYLFLFGLIVVPKLLFSLCAGLGRLICIALKRRINYGPLLGYVAVAICWYILFYGTFIGFRRLEVKHVEIGFADLPEAFDGYRIAMFSDAHVGTYTGWRQAILQRAVDSLNSQRADAIVFCGDLQNAHPRDIYPHRGLLSQLMAPDGVFAVLGNHDYDAYIGGDEVERVANCKETKSLIRRLGWTLLENSHQVIARSNSRIVMAGMENWGLSRRMPRKGDVQQTLSGLPTDKPLFTIMLQHDPSCWREKILPESEAQLTLSGHTHAMQFSLFGWSPVSLLYSESCGLYREGTRAIYVSKGLGGVIPFRFGATGEIVVITLKRATPLP